jgi:integrase
VLEVMTSGAKVWRYRFSLHGKQQPLVTIGDYPATGLMVARERGRRYAAIVAAAIVARFIATQDSRTRVLNPDEIGQVLRAVYVSSIRRPLKLAIHVLVLTMVRKSELIEARWDEFDLDAGIWRIPADRMKKDREHWVYLAPQAVSMLRELHESRTCTEYVFPTVRGIDRPIAKSTLNQAIRAMDIEVQHFVLQDFWRTASTHPHEIGQSSDAIEKALAHTIKGIKRVLQPCRVRRGGAAHPASVGGVRGCAGR